MVLVFNDGSLANHASQYLYSDKLSVLKSRDIILPTKVHIVKAIDYPVVMYGCESWTKKKTER